MSRAEQLEALLGRWIARREEDGHRLSAVELAGEREDLVLELEALIERYEDLEARMAPPVESAGRAPELPEIAGFRTVEQLGAGGMGEVFKLEDRRLGRLVAAKVLRRDSPLVVAYGDYLREARSLALFQDPRIVQIHEYRADNDPPVILMEYVDGFELGAVGPSLDVRQRARVVAQVCRAIHRAHELGLVHRDLKPANIMLDHQLEPKILDFGLSLADPQQGHGVGTPAYLAPEQLDPARAIDARSDVFALGVILYELLCGIRPYDGPDDGEDRPPVPPRLPVEVDPTVPEPLQAVALRAIARDPDERYPSALEMARDLERFLAGRTVTARPRMYGEALGQRVRGHLDQIQEWVAARLVYPHEADMLRRAYRRLEVADDDWIVAGRRLTLSRISLYLGVFLLLCGGLFYFVSRRVYEGGAGGLGEAVATLGAPFLGLTVAGVLLQRRQRPAVAIACYLAAAGVLAPFLLVVFGELGLWEAREGQFFADGTVSNRQLQVAAFASWLWAGLLALRTRTVALSSACAALGVVATLSVLTDLGLRDWLTDGRWDLLALHLAPLLLVYPALGWWQERRGWAWLALPLSVGAAIMLVVVLELLALDGRAFAHLGVSLAGLQPAEVTDPLLLDTLVAMTLNGLVFYLVAVALERVGSETARTPARLLFGLSPFAILEPVAWLNHTGEYSRGLLWLALALCLGITFASRWRQRRSFYYAGLLNTGIALVLVADRYEWLDAPGWAQAVVLVALMATAAGVLLDLREPGSPGRGGGT